MYAETTEVNPVAVEGYASTASVSQAACAGETSIDWVPTHEALDVPRAVAQLCSRCPIQEMCLSWALAWEASGYWAGTTTAQRQGRGTSTPTSMGHAKGEGGYSYYRRGCRCGECRDGNSDRIRRYRDRKSKGAPS